MGIQTITRILACGTSVMGYATFDDPNPHCTHKKRICFGCYSRFCNTCGKKCTDQWNALLNAQYRKPWIVHFSKPTTHPKHTTDYLGRYVTRPPLAMSRLKHYDGSTVVFQYLDHKTHTQRRYTCGAKAFIERFIQHIPDKGFRLIRCYGFLANRVRSVRLPLVYTLLKQSVWAPRQIRFPALLKASFGLDPLRCILCQATLVFSGLTRGKWAPTQWRSCWR